ncbi:alpha/beta hydrolase [Pantoea sp. BAV 3049]|uniref:alpha/beta hydrolase n=1 Tax=Pantoea sp. BAV 3049 TaxID=2654188 RepID=UPI00131CA67E|nr:prolyl oligopeptidase family serine peptidase [Pantoea sp. BAV 3049]
MAKGVVILLHGVGSNGDDLAGLGTHWSGDLPGVSFASPDAPFRFEHGPGYQWFSVAGVTPANRAQRVEEARDAFDAELNAILTEHQMQDQLDKVVLVGFSQGSIMGLDAVISGRWPVAGLVAFSGRLASPAPYSVAKETPVMIIHGMADSVIPYAESEIAAEKLRELGVVVSTQFAPSVGHTISAQGARSAAEFIGKCLA